MSDAMTQRRVAIVLFNLGGPDRPESVQQLDRHDALKALMANTLNLLRSGDDGLQAPASTAHQRYDGLQTTILTKLHKATLPPAMDGVDGL